jgi:hypothetical protein
MWLEDMLVVLVLFFVEKQAFQLLRGFNSTRSNIEAGEFFAV